MSKPFLKVTSDFTKNFNDVISRFKFDKVLVGIPEEDTTRENDAPITNAALLAINNFGSPLNHIPPRPVMAIGIKNAQDEIVSQYKQAAIQALSQGFKALDVYYERVGIIASTSIKKAINSQEGIAAPSPGTIADRKAAGFKGTKALIVTGQMRSAITYVVRGKGR